MNRGSEVHVAATMIAIDEKARTPIKIIVMSDRTLLASYRRTDGMSDEAMMLLAEIERRELDR